jgi:septum formation protein
VLGSTSRYRRDLLSRVLPDFEVLAPGIDETPAGYETAHGLAGRLAREKAHAVSIRRPDAIVIGSDQVAECDGRILGKPGTPTRAVGQLRACQGKTLTLHTAVYVIAPDGARLEHIDHTGLRFRTLDDDALVRYVQRDQPLDCAGAFRFESLGAALFDAVETRDPHAIQGLPLLWLCDALSQLGVRIL